MPVLKLRRDMVVLEDDPATEVVGFGERPFPLRRITPEPASGALEVIDAGPAGPAEGPEAEEAPGRTFFGHVRWWFKAALVVMALGAYPAAMVAASDVGDGDIPAMTSRSDWAAPWIGGADALMEKHFSVLGWASDAPVWSPMARLVAKPAYQSAMAGALGDFIGLMNAHAQASGHADADLEAASRLVSATSTGIQLHAARDALVSYERRMKRRSVSLSATPRQELEQAALLASWAAVSENAIRASAASIGGSPVDEDATRAVYAAKGRAAAAFMVLDTMSRQETPAAEKARQAAREAWRAVGAFHPLFVLNGDIDGSLLPNHGAAMGFLLGEARKATEDLRASLAAGLPPESALSPAPAP